MRAVIVGGGGIGREVAENLARRGGHQLVIIDSDQERCETLAAELDALVLHGDGSNPEMLEKAGLREADALVATTGSDALNTVVAMLGHRLEVPKLIVRLDDVGLRAACQEIGVTAIVAPKLATAAQIVSILYGLHRLDFSVAVRGGLQLVDLPAGRSAGRRLADVELPDDVLVVLLLRGPDVLLARGSTKIAEGDVLLILAKDDEAVQRTRQLLSPEGP